MSRRFCITAGWMFLLGILLLPIGAAIEHYKRDAVALDAIGCVSASCLFLSPVLLMAGGVVAAIRAVGRRMSHG